MTARAKALLPLVIPALAVGIGSSLVLLALSAVAEWLQDVLWDHLPVAIGADGSSAWWTLVILMATGAAVGLVVWKVPGHGGPDPATEGLIAPPMAPRMLPSLFLVTGLALAGGVSLGPENPITAANIALAFAIGARLIPAISGEMWLAMAAAGTVGALFGTPVAAALILSEMPMGKSSLPLWDRLFAPLVAAAAGAITTSVIASPMIAFKMPAYRGVELIDLVSGSIIAVAACAIGLAAVYVFPHAYALFQRVQHVSNPFVMITLGGTLLGVLGMIGGQVTLFKGLDETKELLAAGYSGPHLFLIIIVKIAALLIAATCGFRGGRIFPAMFIGVAIGMFSVALVDSIPVSLAVVCGVLGVLVAITRQGWLSLFAALAIVGDTRLLPVACIAVLPAWLLATGHPEMLIEEKEPATTTA
ncbi:ion channel protein [Actinomadura barringtoniae]|uniref:Ion channel protein n=1 Tax=Actinomadura barringtoniae TaxID=1427535 RepID=A0A939T2D5_9ACTN|nr:ion channel protein [Actinomadura barringtoniae]